MKIGFTIGKFAPLHKGHEYLINRGIQENDEFYILVNDTTVTDIPLEVRAKWIQKMYPNAHVLLGKNSPQKCGMDDESIKIQTDYLKEVFKDIPVTTFYSGEKYGEHVGKALNVENIYIDKKIPISATNIRENLEKNKRYVESFIYTEIKS